jgi:CheY-like chemotaxis protein
VGEDIDLSWLPTTDLWNTVIDPAQLDQILANLLVNARDAIQGSGRIVVSARNIPADQESDAVTMGWSRDLVALEVCDNGCGMNESLQARIFEPFFTTKEPGKGSGLGLATVYGIVTQNNGTIRVRSSPGKGTSLTMYFPAYRGAVAEQELVPIQHSPNTGRETVLLVEDEPMVLSLAQSLLQRLGYHVIATRSPTDAIRIAESDQQSIQLLITDVIMPEMNGKQLADRLLARRNDVRVLYMSGFSADVIARRGVLEEGAQFLQKPFTPGELAARVREVLEATNV